MAVYNKSREAFRTECSKVLQVCTASWSPCRSPCRGSVLPLREVVFVVPAQAFGKEFSELTLKYKKAKYKNPHAEPDTVPIAKLFEKYGKRVTQLQASLAELVQKGNAVLETEQLSMSLLLYWAAHDDVVRQVGAACRSAPCVPNSSCARLGGPGPPAAELSRAQRSPPQKDVAAGRCTTHWWTWTRRRAAGLRT